MSRTPADSMVRTLEDAGLRCAFGLPGTHNLDLFEALRRSTIRTIVPSHELGASFMANGYYRASGQAGLLATVLGPGFAYALPGIAEARLDSAALLHLTVAPSRIRGNIFHNQAIHQTAIALPLFKQVYSAGAKADLGQAVQIALAATTHGEPGPVLLELDPDQPLKPMSAVLDQSSAEPAPATISEIAQLLRDSKRALVFAGQGAAGAAPELLRLVERAGALAVTTTSGRGVLPEDHPRSLGFELSGTSVKPWNDLISASDLVLAIGVKFSHNSSRGFQLDIPEHKHIHVDASGEVIGANYTVRVGLIADAEAFLRALLGKVTENQGWPQQEIHTWRDRSLRESWRDGSEPRICGCTPAEFFTALRAALPRDGIVVTDCGRHQMLVRRHFKVLAPRGLITPVNFQSMGFAIPAAIGAQLAAPERKVIAVVGDGGFLMSGLELLTAVKYQVPLCVFVFDDASFSYIKHSQLSAYGAAWGTDLLNPDFEKFAGAVGCHYVRLGGDLDLGITQALALPGVVLVEVPLQEAPGQRIVRAKGLAKGFLRRWFGRR